MGFEDSLPFFGMLMVILIQVGNMEVSKAAMSAGMNKYILAVYSNALPTLILLPLSFICCRSQRPPVTFSVLCRIFLLALIGRCSGQILEYAGIQYSSPTLCTAMLNLIPAFTFMLAIIFRMEKLEWSSSSSQAKLLGTIVSITGASVVTFYKGPPIMMTPSSSQLLLSPQSSWILGVFTLIIVRDPDAWRLRLDMGLVAILYTGVVSSVLRVSLCTWCLSRTGPFFCSMFKPVAIIFAVVMDVFLGDVLCLGSVIGAAVTVVGFYAVMWGKANEEKMYKDSGVASFGSSSEKIPLLQNRMEEI
ncbi:WAT1-related protein At3g28050-like isoform X3 [Alnus glutinosa]|uniref:WAT1-related protein At3g28050-like isoform X3 n=1 Tax=Alnus glutinosa TaxID=3517 RepID=UPI002D77EAC4|nr:WAT1-related protein At3g28050-like isoform X3 [Alnus glutinosa]